MKKLTTLAAAALALAMTGAGALAETTLQLGTTVNEQDSFHVAAIKFAELVDERTNGEYKIEIYPNGTLGGESDIEYKVRDLLENPNPTAAIYCKTGECEIRITARARSDEDGEKMCRAYAKKFYDMLGDAVYDENVAGLEETVVHTLQEKGLTIATAESCTGGLIAQRLTSVSGSSEVFGYGFVTYWEQAKAKLVGVDPAVIEKYNVVSAPVAAQMALGAAKASGADIAVSVTGVAGPTGGDEVRPVGTVYLGAARDGVAYVKKLFVSRPDRALVRARAAQAALELALRLAQGKVPAGTQALTAAQQSDDEALAALDEVFVR